MKTRNSFIIALVIALLSVSIPAFSQVTESRFFDRKLDFGISAGIWFPGTIGGWNVDADVDWEYGKDTSFLARVFLDGYLTRVIAIGPYFNFSPITISKLDGEDLSEDRSATIAEIGGAFKVRVLFSPKTALKLGLNIGTRFYNTDDLPPSHTGIGLNLSAELQFMLESGFIFFIETGFLAQPNGFGTDDYDNDWEVYYAPIGYLNAGICF